MGKFTVRADTLCLALLHRINNRVHGTNNFLQLSQLFRIRKTILNIELDNNYGF